MSRRAPGMNRRLQPSAGTPMPTRRQRARALAESSTGRPESALVFPRPGETMFRRDVDHDEVGMVQGAGEAGLLLEGARSFGPRAQVWKATKRSAGAGARESECDAAALDGLSIASSFSGDPWPSSPRGKPVGRNGGWLGCDASDGLDGVGTGTVGLGERGPVVIAGEDSWVSPGFQMRLSVIRTCASVT
jgi:hypothetical protein